MKLLSAARGLLFRHPMELPEFTIEIDEETGWLTASWDDPNGGGITTQAKTVGELSEAIQEAVRCHFADRVIPAKVALHFERDPILQMA